MDQPKILYLLGAGASAKVVPIVNANQDFGFKSFIDELKDFLHRENGHIQAHDNGDLNVTKLNAILELGDKLGTPDLVAKYLYVQERFDDYYLFKNFVSSYLMSIQRVADPIESRALAFLTYISDEDGVPPNVKIVSWNYDIQIERSAWELNINQKKLSNKFSSYPNPFPIVPGDLATPFLFHLNGVAGYRDDSEMGYTHIENHYDFRKIGRDNLLSFAWETHSKKFDHEREEMLRKMVVGTNILVVVGYSFPFFNRIWDKMIFETARPTLKRIYYQTKDKNDDGSRLIDLFRLKQKVVPVHNVDFYHIPYEF